MEGGENDMRLENNGYWSITGPSFSEIFTVSWKIGNSDFDTYMSGIKFWKGDKNLRPVCRGGYCLLHNRE
jgi:hypothetical protein